MRIGPGTILACAMLFGASSGAPQTRSAARFDPLDAFVGTWVATNANEQTPYMILRFEERGGKLAGSMNHFRFGVVGSGTLVGSQSAPGEVRLTDLKLDGGEALFTWRVNPPLEGSPTKFVVEGTQVAELVFSVMGPAIASIMTENPGANGFNPEITLRRVSRSPSHLTAQGDRISAPPKISGNWEAAFMARLINTAEAQFRIAHGQYADYLTLLRSGQLEETDGREFTGMPGNLGRRRTLAESDPLPGYLFRLALSADKSTYRLSMREKSKATCPNEILADETGIVTEGCNGEARRRD